MDAPKYHIHADGLHDTKIGELISFINNTPGDLVVVMNSGGGSNGTRCLLQQLFAENEDRLTLVANNGVHSAAFELFYKYTGRKALTQGTTGMWHMELVPCRLASNGLPDTEEDRAIYRGMKAGKIISTEFAKGFMTPDELRRYQKGEDVYFDFERMKQIFPGAKIWS